MPPRCELIPEPTTMEMICQLKKLRPPKFEGETDSMVYKEWFRRMETYLKSWTLRGLRRIWPPINLKTKLSSGGGQ